MISFKITAAPSIFLIIRDPSFDYKHNFTNVKNTSSDSLILYSHEAINILLCVSSFSEIFSLPPLETAYIQLYDRQCDTHIFQ